jgi:hypothetical protein
MYVAILPPILWNLQRSKVPRFREVFHCYHRWLSPCASHPPTGKRRQLPAAQFLWRQSHGAVRRQRNVEQRSQERGILFRVELDQPLTEHATAPDYTGRHRFYSARGKAGSWRCMDEAMTTIETSKETWFEAEVNRLAGEIAARSGAVGRPLASQHEAYRGRGRASGVASHMNLKFAA